VEDTGYAAGFTIGRIADRGTWEIGYVYQDVGKDAQFEPFVDSDFGGGITGSRGACSASPAASAGSRP
jgi:hypothetical protein